MIWEGRDAVKTGRCKPPSGPSGIPNSTDLLQRFSVLRILLRLLQGPSVETTPSYVEAKDDQSL